MKKIYIVLFFWLTGIQATYSQPEAMWQLLMDGTIIRWAYSWGDEFNGTSLDQHNWINSFPWGRNYSGTCSQEYMTDGLNYEFQNGILKLIVKNEDVYARGVPYETDDHQLQDGGPNLRTWHYTSGMLFSNKKFKHGLFEIKCKLPVGRGFWPAFWLYHGGPHEEFDIFEYKGETPDRIHINLHCPSSDCDGVDEWINANGNFSDGFNSIMGEWGPGAFLWYLMAESLNSNLQILIIRQI